MGLEVIGAGFGRTGTESLKEALELLGFGPCDHMFELLKSTHRVEHLEALDRGETPDFDALFDGFRSAVDFPYAMYYRQLMEAYPDAKIILTVRDPESWYDSAHKTILRDLPPGALTIARTAGLFNANARGIPRWHAYVTAALFDDFFDGRRHDRSFMVEHFSDWNDQVQASVAPERLLVFEVAQGWEPLCQFLDVPVPDVPFPRSNASGSFQERMKLRNIAKNFIPRRD